MSLHEITIAPPSPAPTQRPDSPPTLDGVPVVRRQFGGFLQRSDPLETAGKELSQFGFVTSYPVDRKLLHGLVDTLHGAIHRAMSDGDVPGTKLEVVDYDDAGTGKAEPPRRYIVVRAKTARDTHMSIYSTFRTYGDHLFISIRSFWLPPLHIWRMIRSFVLSALLFLIVPGLLGGGGASGLIRVGVLLWIAWSYRELLRSLVLSEPFDEALRRRFPRAHNAGTFNTDDVLMHFDSAWPAVLTAVYRVFEARGIPVPGMREAINQITNNYNNTRIDTGGGAFTSVNSAVGSIVGQWSKMAG